MSHKDRPLEAPTSAAGDSIILHVPACVQQFSSRRRILSRLRALARRRSRGLPELEAMPLKLEIEANPNWRAPDELPIGSQEWRAEAPFGIVGEEDLEASLASSPTAPDAAAQPALGVPPEAPVDPNQALIQQLEEDNRDLKAALCRLIRIAEENEGALRLLEEENEELSALVHRLTIGQTKVAPSAPAPASARVWLWWAPAPGVAWLRRRLDRRCT